MVKMRPPPIFLLYAAVALSLLFILGSLPQLQPDGGRRQHRRLKLRTDFSDPVRLAVRFDPIVADMEMLREDKAWGMVHHALPLHGVAATEWEGYKDAEDFINDETRFNVTHRIEVLFPNIDVEPMDGFVSLWELKAWFLKQTERDKMHRTKRGMKLYDKDEDGFVTFKEFEQQSKLHSHDHTDSSSSDMYTGWFKRDHFHASDMDGDGRLSPTELNDFLHPADSKNPKLISWLCKEEIRNRDKDKDGKLNFEEFYPGLVEFLSGFHPNISHQSDSTSQKTSARELFVRLDLDRDRFLNEKELEPVIGTFHPSQLFFADLLAEQTFREADTDKDGHLSLKEMIDHPYAFYTAVTTNQEYDVQREEFR